jgi:hypothetical protein
MGSECREICKRAQRIGFVDPLTMLPPHNEATLSALLSLYHQAHRIRWANVPLALFSGAQSGKTAAQIFGIPGYLCSEYPLFWASRDELEARGDMRPDFLYLSADRRIAAFVEHKIGGGLTHKGDSYGGQFGRYLKYLVDARVDEAFLILLTSQAFLSRVSPWYVHELEAARGILCRRGEVATCVMTWETILDAFQPGYSGKPEDRLR